MNARGKASRVSETSRFNVLGLRYKAAFDACRAIANRNAQVLIDGGVLSEQQIAEEDHAAAELEKVRAQLMASTARPGK
jgi:hypothetical protein